MNITDLASPATGATGILALVVILILRGLLIPRRVLEERIADKDKQIELWQKAWNKSEAAREIQAQQMTMYLEMARTTTAVIQAIPVNSGRSAHVANPTQDA